MKAKIMQAVDDAIKAAQKLKHPEALRFIRKSAEMLFACYEAGNKVLIAGNGGSLCDAMHFAEELTGQFRFEREALPAIAIADPSHMSCVGNDMGFERVFSRGVEALGRPGDLLIVLTTSGNSQNLVKAVQVAQEKEMQTIGFLGKTGGKLKGVCDLEWIVTGFAFSDRVQEAHMAAAHIIIEALEAKLYEKQAAFMGADTH